jgi:hypothetical protein
MRAARLAAVVFAVATAGSVAFQLALALSAPQASAPSGRRSPQ